MILLAGLIGADPLHNQGKLEANAFFGRLRCAHYIEHKFYSTESLSLYTIWGVLFLIFYGLQSPFYILLFDAQPPITGITLMILHVRSGMRRPNFSTLSVEDASISEHSYPSTQAKFASQHPANQTTHGDVQPARLGLSMFAFHPRSAGDASLWY
ncbi:hypothetical protein BD779DRAFT_1476982 [Infundibulicybe gibba]|nr:hypothetical protein BD779DRAFT_1476982 [Infundibulicybe gibba]